MTIALAFAAGLGAVLLLLAMTSAVLNQPVLARENYRGFTLPTAVGVVLVVAVIAVDGSRTMLGLAGLGDVAAAPARVLLLASVAGFGMLGLVDDLLGDAHDRGLRGHLRPLRERRVTTGFIKLGGGIALSLMLAGAINGDRPLRVLIDGALIALAANLGNLLDRAPGRTLKWGLVCYVPVAVVAGSSATGVALAVVLGSSAGLLRGDLTEKFMLGDTGANALGAALGCATVLVAGTAARNMVALVLLVLTLLSEVVSFSRIIRVVVPLRLFDQLGARSSDRDQS
ncbi:MAG: hypothetical protein WD691_00640 [Acidimicrobiales bacterium]